MAYATTMQVLKYPHPILKYKLKPIAKINQKLRDLIAEMFTVIYDTDGVGGDGLGRYGRASQEGAEVQRKIVQTENLCTFLCCK